MYQIDGTDRRFDDLKDAIYVRDWRFSGRRILNIQDRTWLVRVDLGYGYWIPIG